MRATRGVPLKEPTSMTTTKDHVTARAPLSAEERVLVEEQLERMLASPLFTQSKRYAPFLRHVVEKTLDGQEDRLKERVLGSELFGRAPDYDSNNDPVVRVTAGEVRKRIAQYYDDSAHRNELRIDLPIGTYVAQFHPGLAVDEEHRAAPQSALLQADPAFSPESGKRPRHRRARPERRAVSRRRQGRYRQRFFRGLLPRRQRIVAAGRNGWRRACRSLP